MAISCVFGYTSADASGVAVSITTRPATLSRRRTRGAASGTLNSRFSSARESMKQAALNASRSEEHTSELQSRLHLVCRLLLEKKKTGRATLPRRARGHGLGTPCAALHD